jgi:beta-glucosidase
MGSWIAAVLVTSWAAAAAPADVPYKDARLGVEDRIKDLLGRMTLEEKVAQLVQVSAEGLQITDEGATPESLAKAFRGLSYGALDPHFGARYTEYAKRIRACQDYARTKTRLGIPFLPFCETLHGVLAEGATIFPQTIAQGATWNPDLVREMASVIANEGSAMGLGTTFAAARKKPPRWRSKPAWTSKRPATPATASSPNWCERALSP